MKAKEVPTPHYYLGLGFAQASHFYFPDGLQGLRELMKADGLLPESGGLELPGREIETPAGPPKCGGHVAGEPPIRVALDAKRVTTATLELTAEQQRALEDGGLLSPDELLAARTGWATYACQPIEDPPATDDLTVLDAPPPLAEACGLPMVAVRDGDQIFIYAVELVAFVPADGIETARELERLGLEPDEPDEPEPAALEL